ncbi:MAG: response regulator [Kiritimatiellae bacterium]|nr:response regulator [Kiritimatiellia bacterium]MDW8458815.1 response regulator [Verrucomicrobiota bacterium]
MSKVLIIEDEPMLRKLLERVVQMVGLEPVSVSTGAEGLALASSDNPSLIITDLCLPTPPSNAELVMALRQARPDCPIVVTTGYSIGNLDTRLRALGAVYFLEKPFDLFTARSLIAAALPDSAARSSSSPSSS